MAEKPEEFEYVSNSKFTRKEFIETTGKAGIALGLAGLIESFKLSGKPNKDSSVAIVGAGLAGLHAAWVLKKADINATVYEATDRIGGRVYTTKDLVAPNITTELGGEFMDTNHQDMWNLIKEFKLDTYNCLADAKDNHLVRHTFLFGGQVRSEEEILAEFKKIVAQIQKDKNSIENENAVRCLKLDGMTMKDYLESLHVTGWFYDLLYWVFTSEFGMDADEANSLNLIDLIGVGTTGEFAVFGDSDEGYKIAGGNDLLTKALADGLGEQIQLKHKLIALDKNERQYILSFEGGTSALADYLVIAVPFTTLRLVNISKQVGIPPKISKAIKELGYGTNSKLFLSFNERYWRAKKSTGYLFAQTLQNGWDSSQLQNNNNGPGGYTIFLGGKAGANLQSAPDVEKQFLPELELAFPGITKALNDKVTPIAFNWSKSPDFLCSYSCPKVHQAISMSGRNFTDLKAGNLFFAGEHCSEKFQGFMNGAAETGRVAAEKIIQKMIGPADK